MKICIISLNIAPYFDPAPSAKYGGAEVQAAFLANAFTEAGQDVTLLVTNLGSGITPPYPTLNAYDSNEGIPGLRFFRPRASGILRALELADADVYYQRNAGMITGLAAAFCRRRGKTFVYGAGSDTDFSFRTARVHGLRDRLLFQWGFKRADAIVVQNERQRSLCERAVDKPIRVIPNGVPIPGQEPGERTDAIVWVGGLRRIKRPDLFIELAKRLPDQRFVIIGGGTGTEREYAESTAREAASVPNMTVVGWKPHREVLELVRNASLLVNTSTVEGFPNVYLEAWARGVPVVTFNDVDGLIHSEELGAVCSDLEGMERSISSLMEDGDRLQQMRERARRLVRQRFSAATLGAVYVSFFEELLSRSAT